MNGDGAPVAGAEVLALVTGERFQRQAACVCDPRGIPPRPGCACESEIQGFLRWAFAQPATSILAQTTSGPDGRFGLLPPPPGRAVVFARRAAAVGFELVSRGELTVVLADGTPLRGEVVDESGRPIPGAELRAIHRESNRVLATSSGADGAFDFGVVPDGSYDVLARADGFQPRALHTDALIGSGDLHLALRAPRTLLGQVTRRGEPVANAAVMLTGAAQGRVQTDSAGRFRFDGLFLGHYALTAIEGSDVAAAKTEIGKDPPAELSLELEPGATLEGEVVDPGGGPMPAEVQVEALEGELTFTQQVGTDGRIHLATLPTGEVMVRARRDGFASREGEVLVHLKPGRSAHVRFTLSPATRISGWVTQVGGEPLPGADLETHDAAGHEGPSGSSDDTGRFSIDAPAGDYTLEVSVEGFLPVTRKVHAPVSDLRIELGGGAELRGVVVDASGAPVDEAMVRLGPASRPYATQATATTDKNGTFVFHGVGDGHYALIAEAEVAGDEKNFRSAHGEARVADGSAPEVTLRFGAGRSLAGIVTGTDGSPLAGARVSVSQSLLSPDAQFARTAADGRFRLAAVPDGPLRLFASKEGYRERSLQGVRPDSGELAIQLERLPRIRGTVVDSSGRPVTHFFIDAEELEDAAGHFELPVDLPPGASTHSLEFRAKGHAPLRKNVALTGPLTELGEVRLEDGTALTGRVVDARSGAALADCEVALRLDDDEATDLHPASARGLVRTDANGRFSLTSPSDGGGVLWIAHPGYVTRHLPVADALTRNPIALQLGATIHGRVLDAEGQPADAVAFAIGEAGRFHAGSGDDGAFTLDGLPPGTYWVSARSLGGANYAAQKVELTDSGHVELELRPTHGVEVSVQVDGVPDTAAVSVELLPVTGDGSSSSRGALLERAAGALSPANRGALPAHFAAVPPGSYQVLAFEPGPSPKFARKQIEVSAAPAQTFTLPAPTARPQH